jgi:hypothetical protein
MKPGHRDIDVLLAFKPGFERLGREFMREGFVYDDDVIAFFEIASAPVWDDGGYVPETECEHLEERGYIARADLEQVRAMLTACVRGERFCDGWWRKVLREGTVPALLDRLAVLKDEMERGR